MSVLDIYSALKSLILVPVWKPTIIKHARTDHYILMNNTCKITAKTYQELHLTSEAITQHFTLNGGVIAENLPNQLSRVSLNGTIKFLQR